LDATTDKTLQTANKALFVIRIIFLISFGAFWSIGFMLASFFMPGDFELFVRVMMFTLGVAGSAVCYGYLIYGLMMYTKKYRDLDKVETISTIVFIAAWLVSGALLGYWFIENAGTPSSEDLALFFIIVLGPPFYAALRWILGRLTPGRLTEKQHLRLKETP